MPPFLLPPPRTDRSDAGLAEAIEADLVAARVVRPEAPVEAHLDPDASWAVGPDLDPWRSVVASARFTDDDADRRIAEIVGTYVGLGLGFVWWRTPFHTPADLGQRLLRAGVPYEGAAPAMAMDLDALPRREAPPDGLAIVPVRGDAALDAYLGVLAAEAAASGGVPPGIGAAAAHDLERARREAVAARIAEEPVPLRWVGVLDGRPVATSRLAVAGGAAGLYTVATLAPFRGRGIGRAMTLVALLAGREYGYRIGVLQSTEDGLPVYRRLGFRELFRYEVHERPAPRTEAPAG